MAARSVTPCWLRGPTPWIDNAAAEGDAQQMAEVCNRFQFERQAIKCELHNGNHFHAFVGQ